jgi:hypothetical protein
MLSTHSTVQQCAVKHECLSTLCGACQGSELFRTHTLGYISVVDRIRTGQLVLLINLEAGWASAAALTRQPSVVGVTKALSSFWQFGDRVNAVTVAGQLSCRKVHTMCRTHKRTNTRPWCVAVMWLIERAQCLEHHVQSCTAVAHQMGLACVLN